MKRAMMTLAIGLMMATCCTLNAQTKDTISIDKSRLTLKVDGTKNYFELRMQDGKTKKVSTDKGSAERFRNGGKPMMVLNISEFERKISKIYVASK